MTILDENAKAQSTFTVNFAKSMGKSPPSKDYFIDNQI